MYQINLKARCMLLPKGAGAYNAYFTKSALPQPLNIPCRLPPDLSDFQEVTTTNTNLLVEMTILFLYDLINNDALAVYLPMLLTTPAVSL